MKVRTLLAALAAPLALAACSDSTGSGGADTVALRFGVSSGARAARLPGEAAAQAAAGLSVDGTNGVLNISEIRVVVSRLQLRGTTTAATCTGTHTNILTSNGADDGAEHEAGEHEGCGEFNVGPQFVNLPLDGSQLTVATGTVPAGTYSSLRFKVKNLDDRDDEAGDDDDAADHAAIATLFNSIRAQFPDWPQRASMLVVGTFTPRTNGTLGTPRPFRVFARAEVKLQLPITPPLTVADGSTGGTVSVLLDPAAFFRTGTTVIDLSSVTGVPEFKVEAERAFHSEGHHGRDG